jgi:xanthine dehydrogenase YagS FAD-binding subunit
MARIRGLLPPFDLVRPDGLEAALAILERHGSDAWVLAGGLDTFDSLVDRIVRPKVLVDLGGIADLKGIRETEDGLEIGAMTTLTDVARHPIVRRRFGILAKAASLVASPQIRNQGTIGGNVSQMARCWYYRSGWACYRAGGNVCYAETPVAVNREHAIFDTSRCVAVNPSDTAPALLALDARMVVRSSGGERIWPAEAFFIGPDLDIRRMTVLRPGDLLTAIRIPGTWSDQAFRFEKVRDRESWDFALVSLASMIKASNGTIDDLRLVANGVAARPKRLHEVERAVRGRARDEPTARLAGDLAVRGARPLRHNGYKVPLLRNLVVRALRETGLQQPS